MKTFLSKYLNRLISLLLLVLFAGSYLVMEAWVFPPLPYEAAPGDLALQRRARQVCSRLLQPDSSFQVLLSRFLNDEPNPEVVLLDVDYDVVAEADAWPLPRSVYAAILEKLAEGKPRVAVIDLIFEKPQTPWVTEAIFNNITPDNAQALMPVVSQLNHDGRLKAALEKIPNVLITVLANQHEFNDLALREAYAANLKRHVFKAPQVKVAGDGLEQVFPRSRIIGLRESILSLQLGARGQGFTLLNFDRYGTTSQLPLFHRLQSTAADHRSFFLPNVVAEAVRVAEGAEHYELSLESGQVRRFDIGAKTIRTTPSGEMLVNFYNGRRIPVVRAHEVLNGKIEPSVFTDKIVVFSSNTDFLHDYVETPFGLQWGAEVMSCAISNVLNGDYLYRPPWGAWFELVLLVVILLVVLASCAWLKPVRAALLVTLLLGLVLFFNGWLFVETRQVLGVTMPVSFGVILYLQSTLMRVIREERQKRLFKNALGLYLSPKLSERVADEPELLALKGKEEFLTVFFSDIRNFSSISETMTPEELTSFLQHYFSPMTEIVFAADGTLDKFIGDAIMAFWGAPLPQEDHAARACRAALEMLDAMDGLLAQQRREMPDLPEIRMGIGIHSGTMRVGNMGSLRRLNYTVIGDNVNLGSRLEGLTKHYGVRLIVSEQTWALLSDDFFGRRLDRVKVKGKEEATVIYELLGHGSPGEELQGLLSGWEQALCHYERQEWAEALELFSRWTIERGDVAAAGYLTAIERYRSGDAAGEWPPVSVMTEK